MQNYLQLPKGWGVRLAPTAVGELIPVASPVDVRLWSLGPKDRSHLLQECLREPSRINLLVVFTPTSSVFLAGSAESLKGRGFLMSDHRPRFFRMAVLDTSLYAKLFGLYLERRLPVQSVEVDARGIA